MDDESIDMTHQDMYGDTRFELFSTRNPIDESHVQYTVIFQCHTGKVISHAVYRERSPRLL